MKPSTLVSRSWWKTTILVIAAVAVMVRLGIWQLDRLEQRRAFNTRVLDQQAEPALELNEPSSQDPHLPEMEYRQVLVRGEYDPAHQVVLRNQAWENEFGVHVLTPLKIEGSDQSVLVNRGWVPYDDFQEGNLSQYDETGTVLVKGIIRAGETRPQIGGRADPIPAPGEPPLLAWNVANVAAIAAQTPYSLLPIYIQQAPDESWTRLPYRSLPDLELTEGPHMGYALQWFMFAALLAFGYPFYIRREEKSTQKSREVPGTLQTGSGSLPKTLSEINHGGKR
jgi:surfeit locus 1 family protein